RPATARPRTVCQTKLPLPAPFPPRPPQGGDDDAVASTLTRLAALGTLSRGAGEGFFDLRRVIREARLALMARAFFRDSGGIAVEDDAALAGKGDEAAALGAADQGEVGLAGE